MKMVVTALHDPSVYQIKTISDSEGRLPKEFVCFTDYDDIDVLDIIEGSSGKEAVINPSKAAAKLEEIRVKVEAEALVAYRILRSKEYPSMGDQLDAIYKHLQGDSTDWNTIIAPAIAAVKIKYPKP